MPDTQPDAREVARNLFGKHIAPLVDKKYPMTCSAPVIEAILLYGAARFAEGIAKTAPHYRCRTCSLEIVCDVAERATISCPDCKTYTATPIRAGATP